MHGCGIVPSYYLNSLKIISQPVFGFLESIELLGLLGTSVDRYHSLDLSELEAVFTEDEI
jgi:hypothetical protein